MTGPAVEPVIDLAHLRGWVGRGETVTERIAAFPPNALAATLDRDDPPYDDGAALPPAWHWLHFLNVFPLAEAGRDGHAALGGFLPPVPLPRRMWAGGRLRFRAPVRVGRTLDRRSTVTSVDRKAGRSGDLVFVTVRHEVLDDDTLCLDEEHDIVYRGAPAPDAPAIAPPRAPEACAFSRTVRPDPVLLFRYSALTFNGHRIHYDAPFCTDVEGHEGLVVHGPLLATLLLDLVRRERPEAEVVGFDFRAIAPVHAGAELSLRGAPAADGRTVRLWVRRADGALAMEATASLAR